jgi:hypothetical protein
MTDERALVLAAYAWWRAKRPCSFDEETHLKNPIVNMIGPEEKLLAHVIAYKIKNTRKTKNENKRVPVRKVPSSRK